MVGDGDQLSAVRKVPPPEAYKPLLSSIYSFYKSQLSSVQLSSNFRSLPPIVGAINRLQIYPERLRAKRAPDDAPMWLKNLCFPWESEATAMSFVVHFNEYDAAYSDLEAELCAEAVLQCFNAYSAHVRNDAAHIQRFFEEEIGVVTPHNLHRQKIGAKIKEKLSALKEEDKIWIDNAVRTVDKFQGSDRSCILASMGVSLRSRLQEEEGFLYQVNRFNVTISRPKYRLVFFCSQNFLHHIPKTEEGVQMMQGIKRILSKQLRKRYLSKYKQKILHVHG